MKTLPFSKLAHFTERQLQACEAADTHNYVLYGGAVGGGKSYWLRWYALKFLIDQYNKHGLKNVIAGLFCEDYPALKDRHLSKIGFEFPEWLGTHSSDHKTYGNAFVLRKEYGGGAIVFRNLDDVSKYQCYSDDTEVLTKKGFVNVSECKIGDNLLSLNPETRQMSWQRVRKVFEYDYKGKMYSHFGRFGPSFCVTPNHRMLYRSYRNKKLRFSEARSLIKNFFIPRIGEWKGEDTIEEGKKEWFFVSDGNNGKKISFSQSDFLSFLGWYLSEGCIDKSRWSIRIAQSKRHEHIEELLTKIGVNWHYSSRSYSFNNKALCLYLERFGKSYQKFIPQHIKNFKKEELRVLFDSLIMGDGTKYSDNKFVYVTNSKRLRDDVTEIALKIGFVTTCYTRKAGYEKFPNNKSYFCREVYHLSITRRKEDTGCRGMEEIDYSGKVYCPNVPPYHNILIRHKGRIMFCGQSAEFALVAVDELTKNPKEVFDFLRMRKRWVGIGDTKFIAGTNPGGIGHAWVKRMWLDNEFSEFEAEKDEFVFIPAKATDNPYLTEQYYRQLQGLPEDWRRAYLEGDWNLFKGQFFTEWKYDVHVHLPFKIPDTFRRFMGIDFGSAAPFAVYWIAVDWDKNYWVYREYYVKGENAENNAKAVLKLMPKDERVEMAVADRAIFAKQGYGETVADILRRNGIGQPGGKIPLLEPSLGGKDSRVARAQLFHQKLFWDDDTIPKIRFFNTCVNAIRTIPSLIHNEHRPEDVNTDGDDHSYDAITYLLQKLEDVKTERPKTRTEQKILNAQKRPDSFNLRFTKNV